MRDTSALFLSLVVVLVGFGHAGAAHAQGDEAPDDPYRYGLRTALFPAAFQAGVSQGYFGSAGRAELDLGRRLTVHISGQAAWANVTGQDRPSTYALRAGVSLNLSDDRDLTALSGTVYAKDTPEVGGRTTGAETELAEPQSQYGAGVPEHDMTAVAVLRTTHALRIGYDFFRAVERARPTAPDLTTRFMLDTVHAAYLGYGWTVQWNLSAAAAGGTPQLGYRRFYADALITLPALVKSRQIAGKPGDPADLLVFGGRIGMEGSIDALIRSMRGLGFGYRLELGALPGKSGIEGYLFIGLGLALDAPVRVSRH